MASVSLVDRVDNNLQLELMASTVSSCLMYPSTRLKIEGIDSNFQYKMYLQLGKLVPRYEFQDDTWKAVKNDEGSLEFESIELKRVLSCDNQQSGAYFLKNGICFDNVRLSFHRHVAETHVDTLYVREHFKYVQILIVDRVISMNHTVIRRSIPGSTFIAVNTIQSPQMIDYFERHYQNEEDEIRHMPYTRPHTFVAPLDIEFPVPPHPDPKYGIIWHYGSDPGDYTPTRLPDGSFIARFFGTTYFCGINEE